jgi:hypothetical protein
MSLLYDRRGGNNELSSWHDREHTRGLPFDSDVPVQHRFAVGAEGMMYFKDYIHVTANGDLGWVRNHGNTKHHRFAFDPTFAIDVSIHFSNCVIRLK